MHWELGLERGLIGKRQVNVVANLENNSRLKTVHDRIVVSRPFQNLTKSKRHDNRVRADIDACCIDERNR